MEPRKIHDFEPQGVRCRLRDRRHGFPRGVREIRNGVRLAHAIAVSAATPTAPASPAPRVVTQPPPGSLRALECLQRSPLLLRQLRRHHNVRPRHLSRRPMPYPIDQSS